MAILGPPVLAAAIGAGCDYLDLCDDPEPTVAMLEMAAEAERAGIRAVIGMGASPGIVNLLAVVAMRELDEVHRVVTGWNGEGQVPPGTHPPESAFDPREFFDALAPHCPRTATGQSALLVTRSWNPDASVTYRAGIEAARQRFLAGPVS